MQYITTTEAAGRWGITVRQVQRLLAAERIPGVKKHGRSWLIPAGAEKPDDMRHDKYNRLYREKPGVLNSEKPCNMYCDSSKLSEQTLLSDLVEILSATTLPMPQDNPDIILDTMSDEQHRLHYKGELAYLRGDFEQTKYCFAKTEGDTASRLRASSITMAAAISTGDYALYMQIESFLKRIAKTYPNSELSIFAELCLSVAPVSTFAVEMVPQWLKNGDFTSLMPQAIPDAVYKRMKYFQILGQHESMLASAETALAYSNYGSGVTFHDIYFKVVCIIACCALGRFDEATHRLLEALKTALPHGFITPFIESTTALGGLLEKCLEQKYPQYYDIAVKQWNHTFVNWCSFHNHFTKDNITLILSLRDYQIANLAARGVPYREIAERFHISVGTLNNKMQVIYDTLLITEKSRRQALRKYLL